MLGIANYVFVIVTNLLTSILYIVTTSILIIIYIYVC